MLTFQPLESSSIAGTGYDAVDGRFAVVFKRTPGTAYVYGNVEPEIHDELLAAPSVGSAIGSFAKGRAFEKLDVAEVFEPSSELPT
jgi:hypothetical protein